VTLGALARVELACRDTRRQQAFFGGILGLKPSSGSGSLPRFDLGPVELVLRPRGDALFPANPRGDAGALLAFPVPDEELDRWHRRMLSARVAVLDAPGPAGSPPRTLRIADPEGNVVELYAAG
jgi:catechol 2,3-dioxygenase-like lactoylglutathione lyase family enzyme